MAVTPLKTKEKGTLSTYPVHKYASSNKLEGDVRRQKTPSTLAAVLDSIATIDTLRRKNTERVDDWKKYLLHGTAPCVSYQGYTKQH